MDLRIDSTFPSSIVEQLAKACTVLQYNLTDTLQAIHLYGSAADGGLKPASDLDLLVTVSTPLPEPVRQSLMNDLLSISAPPGGPVRALEVTVVVHADVLPWRYPPRRELQFGEWLREYLQAGKVEPAQLDPDLTKDSLTNRIDQVTAFVLYSKAQIERSTSTPDNCAG